MANLNLGDIMIGSIPNHVTYDSVFEIVDKEVDKEVAKNNESEETFIIGFNEVHEASKDVRMYSWNLRAKNIHDAIRKFVNIMGDILTL